jgi:hypothetical protein
MAPSNVTSTVYQLKYDMPWQREVALYDDADCVAWLDKFPGCENVSFKLLPPPPAEVYYPIDGGQHGGLPQPLVFYGFNDKLEQIDYPYLDRDWSMMSKRMLNTLLAVRDFPHRAFPVVIKDPHLDVFDWENSEYTVLEGVPGRVDYAKKVVLKEPKEGFPPLFRLAAYESRLFVSHAGKTAIAAAGITGATFIPLEKVIF